MAYFTEYKKQSEPGKRARAQNWAVAIGLQRVDNLTPSKYLIDVARDNIEGKISIDDAQREINHYYRKNVATTPKEQDEQQADMVSARIAKLLGEKTFSFSPAEYKSIHGALFDGVLDADTAGKFRTYNITKKESILNGDTVVYGRADSIAETLEYDFERERNFDYSHLTREQSVAHIAKFMSGIWQIHPFAEGNTRATVVFIIKYLDTLGMHTNNDLFEHHAKYFRNALVRANYQNLDRQIPYTTEFLDKFFGNLLLGENNRLDNREMQIKTSKKTSKKTNKKTSEKILAIIERQPSITASELAKKLEITAAGIRWHIDKLKKSEQIRRIGPDKGGHWEVVK